MFNDLKHVLYIIIYWFALKIIFLCKHFWHPQALLIWKACLWLNEHIDHLNFMWHYSKFPNCFSPLNRFILFFWSFWGLCSFCSSSDPPLPSTETLNILWTGRVLQLAVLIYAYAGELCTSGANRESRVQKKRGDRNVESCWYLFISGVIYLLRFFLPAVWKCQTPHPTTLSPPPPPPPFPPPLSAVHICAQMSTHVSWLSERQRKAVISLCCSSTSLWINAQTHRKKACIHFLESSKEPERLL